MRTIYEKLEDLLESNEPLNVKFIRLGGGGDRFDECLKNSVMYFGFSTNQMLDQCNRIQLDGNYTDIENKLKERGYKKINDTMRQIKLYFEDAGDTLWITTANRTIYFGFSKGENAFLGKILGNNETYKAMKFGWTNLDKSGAVLNISGLNGGITKTLAYQSTICSFDDKYAKLLINRILNNPSKEKIETESKYKALVESVETLIKHLSPKDLELLVELIISRSGLKRIGSAGKQEEIIDFEFEHPMTEDVYIVQVKAKTNRREFKQYIAHYDSYFSNNQECKFIYAFHSENLPNFQEEINIWRDLLINKDSSKKIILWDSSKLAQLTVDNGLSDWLINIAPV